MPPPQQYTKKDVIEAAFRVVLKHRLHNLTARSVAKELNSSVAPIYSYFDSMDNLARAVIEDAQNLLLEYTRKPYTKNNWLNIGTGVLFFARDYSNIYRALFLEGSHFEDITLDFLNVVEEQMIKDKILIAMKVENRKKLLEKMVIVTHGFAALICAGLIEDTTDKALISSLYEIGDIITLDALKKSKSINKKR